MFFYIANKTINEGISGFVIFRIKIRRHVHNRIIHASSSLITYAYVQLIIIVITIIIITSTIDSAKFKNPLKNTSLCHWRTRTTQKRDIFRQKKLTRICQPWSTHTHSVNKLKNNYHNTRRGKNTNLYILHYKNFKISKKKGNFNTSSHIFRTIRVNVKAQAHFAFENKKSSLNANKYLKKKISKMITEHQSL